MVCSPIPLVLGSALSPNTGLCTHRNTPHLASSIFTTAHHLSRAVNLYGTRPMAMAGAVDVVVPVAIAVALAAAGAVALVVYAE